MIPAYISVVIPENSAPHMIPIIRAIRELTHCSLRVAKDIYDAKGTHDLAITLDRTNPESQMRYDSNVSALMDSGCIVTRLIDASSVHILESVRELATVATLKNEVHLARELQRIISMFKVDDA